MKNNEILEKLESIEKRLCEVEKCRILLETPIGYIDILENIANRLDKLDGKTTPMNAYDRAISKLPTEAEINKAFEEEKKLKKATEYFEPLFPNKCYGTTFVGSMYSPTILDDAEHKYLEEALRPFKNQIKYISKREAGLGLEYLKVDYDNGIVNASWTFPYFMGGSMYKRMELNRAYLIEELDLFVERKNLTI